MKSLKLGITCLALLCSSISVASADVIEILESSGGYASSYYESTTPNLDTSVFMIGVYEAVNGGGTANIDIGKQHGRDTILVLSAYEPTLWSLTGDGVEDISQVFLYGYEEQTITGLDGQTSFTEFSYEGNRNYQGNTYAYPGNGRVVNHVQSETGLSVDAFVGSYQATQFSIAAGAVPAVPVPEPGSLWLLSALGLAGAGLRRRRVVVQASQR